MSTPVRLAREARRGASPRPSRILDPDAERPAHPSDEGFPALVAEVAAAVERATSVIEALEIAVTLDGRIPHGVGYGSLGTREQCLRRALADDAASPARPRRAARSTIGMRVDGRVVMTAPAIGCQGDRLPDGVVGTPRRWWLSAAALDAYEEAATRAHGQIAVDANEASMWLDALSHRDLVELLTELQFASAHGAPLVFYVEDEVYSNFRFVNNLAGKVLLPTSERCLYRKLAAEPPASWSMGDRMLIYSMVLLLRMGGPAGLEEMSGMQLRPTFARDHLVHVAAGYRALGVDGDVDGSSDVVLAENIAHMRKRARQRFAGYRHVHGINGNKRERYMDPATVVEAEHRLLDRLRPAFTAILGGAVATFEELRDAAEARAMQTAARARDDARHDEATEMLLAELVIAVGHEAQADIAMSRGVRSLSALMDAVDREAWQEIVDWEPPHFYCCALPMEGMCRQCEAEPGELVDILWSIAARMEYNVWHSLPDNLPLTEAVVRRDYVYAQKLPDVAEWSDQHHRGHVTAGVRYSIRAPGAVELEGRTYNALTDVRLMRREGPPFDVPELALGRAGARLAATLAEARGSAAARTGVDLRIDAFRSDWYARRLERWVGTDDPNPFRSTFATDAEPVLAAG